MALNWMTKNKSFSLDLSAKFSLTVSITLIFIITVFSLYLVHIQKNTVEEFLIAIKNMQQATFESNVEENEDAEALRAKYLSEFLAVISGTAIAESDFSLLSQYADTVVSNPSITFIAFKGKGGKFLASAGDRAEINEKQKVQFEVLADGEVAGTVIMAYNMERFADFREYLTEENETNLKTLSTLKEKSIQSSMINLMLGSVLLTLCVGCLTYFLFQLLVINRLSFMENRFQDIAEGEGDLRQRITVAGTDIIDRLGQNFNSFIEKIHATMREVTSAIDTLKGSTSQLSTLMEQASLGAEKQQQETDHVASSINEMAATSVDMAKNAVNAASAIEAAEEQAKDGNQIVSLATSATQHLANEVTNAADVIHKLQTHTESIATVLDVIRGISEQTNLLALNAAIEAARAGDHGRGFAVVADEVRSLAKRSKQSTEEIRHMVEAIQDSSTSAVKVMEESKGTAENSVAHGSRASESLQKIAVSVSSITEMNQQIASATDEQSAVAEELNKNVVRISEIAGDSADGARKAATATEDLAHLADQLARIVSQFKV